MSASVLTGALVGAGAGLTMVAIVVAFALNPPENYRRNMGYKRFSEYDPAGRRRVMVAFALNPPENYRRNMGCKRFSEYDPAGRRPVMVACCFFGIFMVVAAGGLGAWALPRLP